MDKVPDALRDKLGIAIGQQLYKAYRDILALNEILIVMFGPHLPASRIG
jgi:hypothetical protein